MRSYIRRKMDSRLRNAIAPALLSRDEAFQGYYTQSCASQLEMDTEKWEKVLQRTAIQDRG